MSDQDLFSFTVIKDVCFPGTWPPTILSSITSKLSLVLCIIITSGNLLLFIAIIRDPYKRLRTPFAFFLANLCASDLIFGSVAMPISYAIHHMEEKRKLNNTYVMVLHLCYFISASASVFSMAALCFDRHSSMTSSLMQRVRLTRRQCISISVYIWLLAGSFSMLYFLTGFVIFMLIVLHVALIMSFGITLVTYFKILTHLRSLTRELSCSQRSSLERVDSNTRKKQRESKITRTFLVILLASMVTYFPALVITYALQFCLSCSCDIKHILRDTVLLIVSTASATNPVVCALRLRTFRKAMLAVIKCKKKEDNISSYSFESKAWREMSVPSSFNLIGMTSSASVIFKEPNKNARRDNNDVKEKMTWL